MPGKFASCRHSCKCTTHACTTYVKCMLYFPILWSRTVFLAWSHTTLLSVYFKPSRREKIIHYCDSLRKSSASCKQYISIIEVSADGKQERRVSEDLNVALCSPLWNRGDGEVTVSVIPAKPAGGFALCRLHFLSSRPMALRIQPLKADTLV